MFKSGWRNGQARIVAREFHQGQVRSGINVYANTEYETVFDYVADVEPDSGGSPFRATFTELFKSNLERQPAIGDLVRVKFDPKSQDVRFDHKALWEDAQAANAASKKRLQTTAEGPSPALAAAKRAGETGVPTDAEMTATYNAFNAALTNGRSAVEAVRQAKSDGRNAEAERLKADVAITNNEVQALNDELRRLQALRPDWRTGSHPGAREVTSADDPLDRLQKLADLHDRGVLTDAEFATQKAKVLSEE